MTFRLRNDTDLYFLNDIREKLEDIVIDQRVMFVYGGGSVKRNGCYDDVKEAVEKRGGVFIDCGGMSREYTDIQKGIALAKSKHAEVIIGAGGASVMDAAKLIAFGVWHQDDLWQFIASIRNPYHLARLPLILIPTYPSSGSEYGLGAVCVDTPNKRSGTAYGIAADNALLCPKYSESLDAEMTAYTALVTLVQLSASVIGDHNPMSYDAGVSYMRNVLKAARVLKKNPHDNDARGIILIGAAMSTSSRLGLGKEINYAYDIYEIEDLPERLFNAPYRQALTAVFPSFLEHMGKYHEKDIRKYLKDVYGLEGDIQDNCQKIKNIFEETGIPMTFDFTYKKEDLHTYKYDTELSRKDIEEIIASIRKER